MNKTEWMITFSDLLIILLTMFVLQLSMSTFDTEALSEKLTNRRGSHLTESPKPQIKARGAEDGALAVNSLTVLAERLRKIIGAEQGEIVLDRQQKEVSVHLASGVFFADSGEITFLASGIISEIGRISRKQELRADIVYNGQDWVQAERLSEVLFRQFVDAGASTQALSVFGKASPQASNKLSIRLSIK